MTTKYTPGPWRAEFPDEISVRDADGGRIAILANLKGRLGMQGRRDTSEVEANARLIAGAPDLLRYLKEARSTLEMWKDVAPAVSLCADIDAAIAKATGEQP